MKPIRNNRKPARGSAEVDRLCRGYEGRNLVPGGMANGFHCAGADEVAAALAMGLPSGALWLGEALPDVSGEITKICVGNYNKVVSAPFAVGLECLSSFDPSDSPTGNAHQRHIRPKIASKLAPWP